MCLEKISERSQLGFLRMVLWYTGHGINLLVKMVLVNSIIQTEQVMPFMLNIEFSRFNNHRVEVLLNKLK